MAGSIGGPLVNILFINVVPTWKIGKLEFNGLTNPAWMTAILAILGTAIIFPLIKEPPKVERKKNSNTSFFSDPSQKKLSKVLMISNISLLFFVMGYWTFQNILIPIGASKFQLHGTSVSKVYIPIGVGALVAGALQKRIPEDFNLTALVFSPLVSLIGLAAFLPLPFQENVWWLYIGTGIVTVGVSFFQTSYRVYYTNLTENNPYETTLIAFVFLTNSLGKFIGPAWSTLPLSFSGDSTCCNPTEHLFNCCNIHGVQVVIPVAMALIAIGFIIALAYIRTVPQKVESELQNLLENEEVIN